MKAKVRFLLASLSLLSLEAGTINLGVLSLDTIQPGLDAFSVANYTGDPGLGGLALGPLDFPVYSFVTLEASALTVYWGSFSQLIFLGDIAPGTFTSSALEFSSGVGLSAAVFTATMNQTILSLADNSTRSVASEVSITLLPGSGQDLRGGDLAVITASEVPEPVSGALCVAGFLLARWMLRRTRAAD